jgi:cell division septation protein DedD
MAEKKKNSKKAESKGFLKSRTGRFTAVFLISVWMFVLGVLVGRGTAPVKFDIDKLSKELAELKQQDIEQQMARLKVEAEDIKPKTDLEFYEELKKNPQAVKRKIQSRAGSPDTPKEETESKQAPARKPSTEAASSRTQEAAKAEPAQKQSRASSEKPAAAKALTIQAASLKEMKAADTLVARLKEKGYPAYKTIGVVPDKGIWFRVRIGEYGSPADAAGTLERLKKDGFEPLLIQK